MSVCHPEDRVVSRSPDVVDYLADLLGGFAAWASDVEWTPDEVDSLRPHILRVASVALTDKQFDVLSRLIGGQSLSDIARDLDITRQAVQASLGGGSAGRGGIGKKLSAALGDDPAFVAAMRTMEAARVDAGSPPAVLRWYAKILVPSRPELFIAMAVLMVAADLAGHGRSVRVADLYACLPRAVVDHALGMLKRTGFVMYDGNTVKIVRTPVDEVPA